MRPRARIRDLTGGPAPATLDDRVFPSPVKSLFFPDADARIARPKPDAAKPDDDRNVITGDSRRPRHCE